MNIKFYFIPIILFLFQSVQAQDSIIVQTITFDDYPMQRGVWEFPEDPTTYRKILMYYTLKCPNTSQGCGEWDYSAPNILHVHTGNYDSVKVDRNRYLLFGQAVDTINYVSKPYRHYYQNKQYFLNYSSAVENDYAIGNGILSSSFPFGTTKEEGKTQMLWTATELQAAGLNAGTIDKLRFDVLETGETMKNLTVRIKHTDSTQLKNFEGGDFTEVYSYNTSFSTSGMQTLNFHTPFTWDGISNIIVQFTFDNKATGVKDTKVKATNTGSDLAVYHDQKDGYLNIEQGNYVNIPLNGYDFSDQITISFLAKGDASTISTNTSIMEGVNSKGVRRLNLHFPWSNNQLYWDAGDGHNIRSRINKGQNGNEVQERWNHWAFTKNATTGNMKIWKNGEIWEAGINKNDSILSVFDFYLGKSVDESLTWQGKIDEFRMWDVELDAEEINNWINRPIDNSHPNYDNLVVYYDFNNRTILDKSPNGRNGIPSASDMVRFDAVGEQTKGVTVSQERPNVIFVQGVYTSTLDSISFLDSALVDPIPITEYTVLGESFLVKDVHYQWPEGWSYTYNSLGQATDSTWVAADASFINEKVFYYEKPHEVINRLEIGRYITPYGNGLNLGDGFTWVYDVTDYAPYLRGSVDFEAKNGEELMDIKFIMIKGTPPRDVIQVSHVWEIPQSSVVWGHYRYEDLDDDIKLSNTTVTLHDDAEYAKLHTLITGHGHHSTDGNYPHCCEWWDNTHYLLVNQEKIADWHIWQTDECALNPVFPQGGTWPGAREGWCPGDVVKGVDYELTSYIREDNTLDIDYDITPVPSNNVGMGDGVYDMTMDLVEYGAANHTLDAEIYDVINPNNWEYYSRTNPICEGIRVVLRNSGSATLTSAMFEYSVSGGTKLHYLWEGNLEFMESEEIELPVVGGGFWLGDEKNIFTVTVSEANGKTDEYEGNNTMSTQFELPDFYTQNPILFYKTNNVPLDNSITITNVHDSIVYYKSDFLASTIYRDTLHLPDGCYTLLLLDEGNDGLYYWAYTGQGTGFFNIRDADFRVVKNFEREFGREIRYSFVVGDIGDSLVVEPIDKSLHIAVFPNPSDGNLHIDLINIQDNVSFKLVNSMGQTVYSEEVSIVGSTEKILNLNYLNKGVYYLIISHSRGKIVEKIVFQ